MSSSPDNRYNNWDIPPKEQWLELKSWADKRHIKTDQAWQARPSDAREKALLDIITVSSQEMQQSVPKGVMIYHSPHPNRYYNARTDTLVFSTAGLVHLSADDLKAAVWNMLLDRKHKDKDRAVDVTSKAITAGAIVGTLVEGIVSHGTSAQVESALIGFGVPTVAISGAETYKEMAKISRAVETAEVTDKEAVKNVLELDPKTRNPRRTASAVERALEKKEQKKIEDNKSR